MVSRLLTASAITATALVAAGITASGSVAGAERAVPADPVSIVAVGDIACQPNWPGYNNGNGRAKVCRQKAVAGITRQLNPAQVLTLGDQQYETGQLKDFRKVFGSLFGSFLNRSDLSQNRLWPVPGNHEYGDDAAPVEKALGYWAFFNGGSLAKPRKTGVAGALHRGWYRRDIGAWTILALNANCTYLPRGCSTRSAQYKWLEAQLASSAQCTLAYWHQPLFNHGKEQAEWAVRPFWRLLLRHDAELILNGHDHSYQRFPPLDEKGKADPNGLIQFVVGTGGHSLVPFARKPTQPPTVTRSASTVGVLQMSLNADSYDWQFVPANFPGNGSYTDSGSNTCH